MRIEIISRIYGMLESLWAVLVNSYSECQMNVRCETYVTDDNLIKTLFFFLC